MVRTSLSLTLFAPFPSRSHAAPPAFPIQGCQRKCMSTNPSASHDQARNATTTLATTAPSLQKHQSHAKNEKNHKKKSQEAEQKQEGEDSNIILTQAMADSQAQSTNFKEAFSLFDKRGNGRVTLDSLGDLLRACGQNPTQAEIRDLEGQVGGDFDFDGFTRVLNRPGGFREPGEPEEYCRGFQVFDKDLTGFIGVGQFRYILTNLGEKMSDEEVDELLKAVDTSSGELNYMDMVKTILAN